MTQQEFWQEIKMSKFVGDLICIPAGVCLSKPENFFSSCTLDKPAYAIIVRRCIDEEHDDVYFEVFLNNERWLLAERFYMSFGKKGEPNEQST